MMDITGVVDVVVVILHIAGTIIVLGGFSYVVTYFFNCEKKRILRVAEEEVAFALGIKLTDLDKEEVDTKDNVEKVYELVSKKFSDELLKNRLSDFCRDVLNVIDMLGFLVMFLVFVASIWYTVTGSIDYAIYSWLTVGVAVVFFILNVAVSSACRLLTGRYPGQAKAVRKAMID